MIEAGTDAQPDAIPIAKQILAVNKEIRRRRAAWGKRLKDAKPHQEVSMREEADQQIREMECVLATLLEVERGRR